MDNLSRRSFIQKGTLAVGAAGVVAAGPALGRATRSGAGLPAAGRLAGGQATEASLPAEASKAGPIVAHVRDVRTGEIDVFVGAQRFTVQDRAIAARLYRATH